MFSIIAALLTLVGVAALQFAFFPPLEVVEWYSVFAEGLVALVAMAALFVVESLHRQTGLYRPLAGGFYLLFVSYLTDLLDEFLDQPHFVTVIFEDLALILGSLLLIYGIGRWVSYNYQLQQELEQLAITDYLTGALNRRGLRAAAEQEIQRSQRYATPLSLIAFDLDEFKRINDRYGHAVGDEVLAATAAQVRHVIRSIDLFARTGGEEFALLLPETRLGEALKVAEKLRQAFADCDCAGEMQVTASFGVCMLRSGEGLDELLQRADAGLYQAKNGGRDQVVPAG